MAQLKLEMKYTCLNDCVQSGCPSHTAILEFNSVADIYFFDDGNLQSISLDRNQAQVLIDMFRQYSEDRADTIEV